MKTPAEASGGAPQVRPLAAEDFEGWRRLWEAYVLTWGEGAAPQEAALRAWAQIRDPAEPIHGLAAGAPGAPIAFAHYLYHPDIGFSAPICFLQDLFTAPEARGRGAARALIEAVAEAARKAGAAKVYWLTHESNLRARRLYDQVAESSGFLQYRKIL